MAITAQANGIHSKNRVSVRRIKETTWGVTPSTPALAEMRKISSKFSRNTSTGKPSETRSDRMNNGVSIRSVEAGGSINANLSAESYDQEIEAALMTEYSTAVAISSANIAALANGFSITATGFSVVEVGQWLWFGGFSNTAIDGFYQVSTIVGGGASITTTVNPVATETAGQTVIVRGKMARNGLNGNSFTVQEAWLDHSTVTYRNSTGQYIDGLDLSMSDGSDVEMNLTYKGKDTEYTSTQFTGATTAEGEGTVTQDTALAVNTNNVMDTVSSLENMLFDGVADGEYLNSFNLSLKNNVTVQRALAQGTSAVGTRPGDLDIEAAIEIFFRSIDEATDFIERNSKSFSIRMVDPDNNAIIITLPAGTYSQFEADGAANTGDSTASATFAAQAYTNSEGESYMIQVDIITQP